MKSTDHNNGGSDEKPVLGNIKALRLESAKQDLIDFINAEKIFLKLGRVWRFHHGLVQQN